MAVTSTSALWETIEASKLLPNQRAQALRQRFGGETDLKTLAKALLDERAFSRWQLRQLLAGHTALSLGKYRILDQVSSDETGQLFLAEHAQLSRRGYIRSLSRSYATKYPDVLPRFLKEAQTLAALDHPNLIHIYDIDSQDERYFVVMEYVVGRSLQKLVEAEGVLPNERLADYLSQIASGLDHAHRRNLVHGELRPSSLLLDATGVVKLVNLGLRRLNVEIQPVEPTLTLENYDYLAPEQAPGQPATDPRSDLYSLGCVGYFLFTGHPPFATGTGEQRRQQHAAQPIPNILSERPDAPRGLVEICSKLLAKDPAERYPTAADVVKVLQTWLESDECQTAKPQPAMGPGKGGGPAADSAAAKSERFRTADEAAAAATGGVDDFLAGLGNAAPAGASDPSGGSADLFEDQPWTAIRPAAADGASFFGFLNGEPRGGTPESRGANVPPQKPPEVAAKSEPASAKPAPPAQGTTGPTTTPAPATAPAAKPSAQPASSPPPAEQPVTQPASPEPDNELAFLDFMSASQKQPAAAADKSPPAKPASAAKAASNVPPAAPKEKPVAKPAAPKSPVAQPESTAAKSVAPAKPKPKGDTAERSARPPAGPTAAKPAAAPAKPASQPAVQSDAAATPAATAKPTAAPAKPAPQPAVQSDTVAKPAAAAKPTAAPAKPAPQPAVQSDAAAKPATAAEPGADGFAMFPPGNSFDAETSAVFDFASPTDLRASRKPGRSPTRKPAGAPAKAAAAASEAAAPAGAPASQAAAPAVEKPATETPTDEPAPAAPRPPLKKRGRTAPSVATSEAGPAKRPIPRKVWIIGGAAVGWVLTVALASFVIVHFMGGRTKPTPKQDDSPATEAAAKTQPAAPADSNTEPTEKDSAVTPSGESSDDSMTVAEATPPADSKAEESPATETSPGEKPEPATTKPPAEKESPAEKSPTEPPAMEQPPAGTEPQPAKPPEPTTPQPSPPEPKPEPPPAAPAKKAFADFPSAVVLPSVTSTEPKDLGPVHTAPDQACTLMLYGGELILKKQEFVLRPASEKSWEVATREGENGPLTRIGQFSLNESSHLVFTWLAAAASHPGAGQFQNCALSLRYLDQDAKLVSLREAKADAPLTIDPDKSLQRHEWKLEGLPDLTHQTHIRLAIIAPKDSLYEVDKAGPIAIDKGTALLRVKGAGELVAFKLDTSLKRTKDSGQLTVTVASQIKLPSEGKAERLLGRRIRQSQEFLKQLIPNLESQVQAGQKLVAQAPNPTLEGRLTRLTQDLEEAKTHQTQVGKLQAAMEQGGGRLQVQFRVYFQADTSEVDLLRAGQ